MIPKVGRGSRVQGLISYLVGPGKSNEHTDPHLVAGDSALLAWYSDNQLGAGHVSGISRHLDRPRVVHNVEVRGGHVWHCSLSLAAVEGQLEDQKWAEIAADFVSQMGFDDAEGAKAPTRWVAVRHGLSKKGNDHIHIVVNLVREDGTKASIHKDCERAQDVCRGLEKKYELAVVEGPGRGRSSRGYHGGELVAEARRSAKAAHRRAVETGVIQTPWEGLTQAQRASLIEANMPVVAPRVNLGRVVRGCATSSMDEAEFVRRLRRQGLLVRVRQPEGAPGVVIGYSVAFPPEPGDRPIWYSGGRLSHDLSLDRLRQEWPDTVTGATLASAEWVAAHRKKRVVAPGREVAQVDPNVHQQIAKDLAHIRRVLRDVPVTDRQTWARVARHAAGVFAAWSAQVETVPGPLAATCDALARSAELKTGRRPDTTPGPSFARAATLLATVAGGNHYAIQRLMIRQLANLAKALHDMHVADKDLHRATAINQAIQTQLRVFAETIPAVPESPQIHVLTQQEPLAVQSQLGSPVPAVLKPHSAPAKSGSTLERD